VVLFQPGLLLDHDGFDTREGGGEGGDGDNQAGEEQVNALHERGDKSPNAAQFWFPRQSRFLEPRTHAGANALPGFCRVREEFAHRACPLPHRPYIFQNFHSMLLCLDSSIISGYLSRRERPGLGDGNASSGRAGPAFAGGADGEFSATSRGAASSCRTRFPRQAAEQLKPLADHQTGYVGQMTASHRVLRVPRSRRQAGPFMEPAGLKNMLMLEWYNRDQQRVLIQSWHLHLTVSAPRWQLSLPAEKAQIRKNWARRSSSAPGRPARERAGFDGAGCIERRAGRAWRAAGECDGKCIPNTRQPRPSPGTRHAGA